MLYIFTIRYLTKFLYVWKTVENCEEFPHLCLNLYASTMLKNIFHCTCLKKEIFIYFCKMVKNIENKIRFNAVVIYIIVAVGVIAMTVYINNIRKNISSQRIEFEKHHALLLATNKLLNAVDETQSLPNMYLTTKNKKHLIDYISFTDTITKIITTITDIKPDETYKLYRIEALLREQAQNIRKLNIQFAERNPVADISEKIQGYEPQSKDDTLYISSLQSDTVISEAPRKNFFKRIGDVFKPKIDTVKVVVSQRVDTIRTVLVDSLAIIYEVGDIVQKAQQTYEQNIKTIEKHVSEVMHHDKELASEVSALLLELYKETLVATLHAIDNSEKYIERNYANLVWGGILALLLILVFITLIITDINKGRKARKELEIANERTLQIMESRHKLLLAVSHDIKSPLNSILGYLSTMKSEPNVRSMQNSSEHILSMLENLLEFSSLEQGTLQKNMSDFNISDLLKDIYEMFLPLASQKNITLLFEADNLRINSDRVKLKQIVINLVSNAIKYTKAGTVEFKANFDKNTLTVEVRDTGLGIPVSKLSQVFIPFKRIEANSGVASGTGLGMFIVKGLVELLGGKIIIKSKVAKGTKVIVTIPAECAKNAIPHGTKKIKVYDDDPVVVKVVSDMILRLGHKIVDSDCDLIITDMDMGDTSGLDVLKNAGKIPVILMSGHSCFSNQKALELGFNGFLQKPLTIESLREIIGDGEAFDDFMCDNREEIMELFRASTAENFAILRQALVENDFKKAQATCHKMFPMFAHMGYPVEELRKMDSCHNHEYENWHEDVEKILQQIV